ncbi:MAG: hypothetical protein EHM12_02420 [Dehalococcoidia bacterium]|nr:MAG: hypothetical protein EHM12_02420 [Dehalococcoidia bacterium]
MAVDRDFVELNKQYEILVCTGEVIFTGTFKCSISQRLIDALNEGVRETAVSKAVDFLPLHDVAMHDIHGNTKKFNRIFVSKHNIIFIAQLSTEIQGKKLNAYPYRKKQPVGVTIYTAQIYQAQVYASPYVIKGQMYVETWGQVADTIESKERFLPFTDVEVTPAPPGGGSKFDFIAINRERMISICEGAD